MDWVYKKVMAWFVGEALANSDRVKTAIYTAVLAPIGAVFALAIARCQPCADFLTPELATKLALGVAATIVSLGIKLIHSLDVRDVAAPGEVVEGAAHIDVRALMDKSGSPA